MSGDIDLPEFTIVGTVDDQQFMYFDSDTMKAEPKTTWIRADYCERETHFDIKRYYKFKNKMEMVKNMFNQSMSTGILPKPPAKMQMQFCLNINHKWLLLFKNLINV